VEQARRSKDLRRTVAPPAALQVAWHRGAPFHRFAEPFRQLGRAERLAGIASLSCTAPALAREDGAGGCCVPEPVPFAVPAGALRWSAGGLRGSDSACAPRRRFHCCWKHPAGSHAGAW